MKRRLFTLLLLSAYFFSLKAQYKEPVTIPTPNTATLAQYGVVPMSLHTGKANISIPLLDVTARGVKLSASLLYDTSGILVNSLPSWTGHSWTLSVGGVITRAVKGYPDEFDTKNHASMNLNWENYFRRYNVKFEEYPGPFGDYMPDVFYFNFMGHNGKFFLGNDGEWKVASDENLMVEFDFNNPDNFMVPFIDEFPSWGGVGTKQPKSIKGFTVTDQDGNRYTFGGAQNLNASEYSINLWNDNNGNENCEMYANSWYLTAVHDRYGNELFKFEYERGLWLISASVSYQLDTRPVLPMMMLNSPVYLSRVTSRDGTEVYFVKDTKILTSTDFYQSFYRLLGSDKKARYDKLLRLQNGPTATHYYIYLSDDRYAKYQNPNNPDKRYDPLACMGMSPLKEIRISKVGKLRKSYVLNYNTDPSQRLHLTGIDVKDGDGAINGTYRFKYYNDFNGLPMVDGRPDYLTQKMDYWGYYNGKTRDRTVDEEKCKYGMLTEIQYPTGGVTTIEYESNRYDWYRNYYHDGMELAYVDEDHAPGNKLAGGLRVKTLHNYEDTTHAKLLGRKVYTYRDGQLSIEPCGFLKEHIENQVGLSIWVAMPMANMFGHHIGYSEVKEDALLGGDEMQTIYGYTNFSDYKEESCHQRFLDYRPRYQEGDAFMLGCLLSAQYDEWSERDYMKGKLRYVRKCGDDDAKWSETRYVYRKDSLDMEKQCVVGYMDLSKAALTLGVPGKSYTRPYKLYYPKYDEAEKVEYIRLGYLNYMTDVITDTTMYSHKDLTVDISGDYSHKADMRLLEAETVCRQGASLTKTYSHQFFNYHAPVVSIREYRNGIFCRDYQTKYGSFPFGVRGSIMLPQYVIERYANNSEDTLLWYKCYTANFLPKEYVRQDGQTVQIEWDQWDNLLIYKIGDFTTSFEYDDGMVSRITEPNQSSLNYEYDSMQRLSGIKNSDGSYLKQFKYGYRTGSPTTH